MKTKSLFAAIFGFLATIAWNSTAFAQVNLLTNGDFSANAASFTTPPGYLGSGANPATITGWTYTPAGGGAGINGVGISTPFGPTNQTAVTYYAFEQNAGTLSQNIPTIVANHAYVLDYFAASRSGQNAPLTVLIKDSAVTYTTSSFVGSNAAFVQNTQYFASPAAITGTPLIQLTNTTGGPDVTGDFGKVRLFDATGVWSGQVSGNLGGPSVNFHGQTFAQAAAASGGTLQFNGTTVAGGIVSNTLLTTVAGGVSTGTLAFNNTGADYAVLSSDASGISGATAITKAGSGTLMLGGTHTYTGTTTISGGTLVAGGAFALNGTFEYPAFGPGGWSYAPAGATWAFGAQSGIARNGSPWVNTAPEGLQVGFVQNSFTMNETFVAGAAGTYTMTFQAANRPGYPDSGITVQIDGGTVATFSPGTFNSGGAFNTFTISGLNLTQGTHTLNFIGTQQGADSATAIDRIRFSGNVSGSIPSTNAVNLTASGATLDLNSTNQTLGSLAGVAGSQVIDNRSLTVGGSNTSTTFAGVISGTGTVTKTGTGTLTLSGNNTFTGSLTLNANSGTVVLSGNNSARPANVSGLTTINSGSILQLQANAGNTTGVTSTALSSEQTANQPLILNNGGTLQLRSDSDVIFAGANNFGGLGSASVTIDVNQINSGNLNHTLAIAPGGFSVGQTTLNVTGGNGYTLGLGKITQVGAGDGSLTLNPTTANVAIAAIDKGAANYVTNIQGSGNTIVGPISGTGAVNKSGTGTLILGAPSTYTGPTTISGGTVQLAATPAAPAVGNGNFEAPVLAGNSFTYYGGGGFTGWGTGGNGANGPALVNNSAAWGYTQPYPSPNQALSLQSTSFITQSLNFTAPGYFTLNWSAASRGGQTNPYNVLVDGVSVGSFSTNNTAWNANATTPFLINSAGSHTISFVGTTAADQSVGLDNISITGLGGNLPSTTAVNINGATGVLDLNSRAQTIGSLAGVAGSQVINNNANLTTGGDNTSTLFAGVISGTGSLTKTGSGTFTVTGLNTFTGVTDISQGALNVGTFSNYGVAGGMGARTAGQETAAGDGIGIHIGSGTTGATLQYTGATAQSTNREIRISAANNSIDASGSNPAATLSFTHTGPNVNLFDTPGARTLTLTGSNTGPNSFSIQLTNQGASQTTLAKTGAGTWFIANSDNSYTGETIIGGGILNVASVSDYGVASSIGARTAAEENNTVTGIGLHFQGGTLQYTGSTAQSTNRQIRMLNGNGATIDASGSNPAATLSFTYSAANTNLFDTPGTRTLTLTGTNTGDNLFAIQLTDQGGSATSVTKTAAGTWVLSNPNSSYSGATLVQGGTLKVTANNALGSNTGSTTVSTGARLLLANTLYTTTETLNLNGAGIGAPGTDGALFATGNSRWDGNINVVTNSTIFTPTGATLVLGNSGSPGTIDKNNTTLTFSGGGTVTVNSQITGVTDHTSDLNVTLNTTVILTNVNNIFMGPINIQNGTLKLGASNVVPNGTEINFGGVGPNYIFDTANGGSNFNDTVRGLSSVAAGNGITRNSQNATNSILTLSPQGVETWTYSGNIEKNPGTINLVLNGSSTARQQLSGTNDVSGLAVATSGGTLQITGGTTQVTGTGGITPNPATAPNFLPANNVAPQAGATLDVNSSGHLIVNNGGAFTLSGGLLDFRDYAAGGALNHKPADAQRSMIQVQSGGAFTFSGGTLRDVSVIGLPAAGGGTFTQNGATSRFVIGQDMIGPGATTTVNGNYTLQSGVLAFDIFGAPVAPEDAYSILDPNDRLDVHGLVTLNGTLEINFPGFTPLFHQDWNIITSDNPIVLQPGFNVAGAFYRIVPIGGGGNGQALQVFVPEPGTIALWSLVGLLAGGYALRRRIRRA